ncbi:MAG: AMP-binding protein [Deinococcales bacterium]
MLDWLYARSLASPKALALEMGDEQLHYAELQALSAQYAGYLEALGLAKGQRVGLMMMSSFAYVALIHALLRLNAVIVPLNSRLTAEELDYQLAKVGLSYLIYDEALADYGGQQHLCQGLFLDELGSEAKKVNPLYQAEVSLEDEAIIIFSSGTTGKPKGVCLSLGNVFYSAVGSSHRLGTLPHDLWLSVLPFYHIGGLSILLRSCLYGTAALLHPRFELETIHHDLIHKPVTLVSLVPTMLYRLLTLSPQAYNAQFRLALLGGAATRSELVEEAHKRKISLATSYGLSEAASQVATALMPEVIAKAGTVGKGLMLTQISIREGDLTLGQGQVGEICVKGPNVMQGYLNDEKASQKSLRSGWLYSGDMGYLDDEGSLLS